VIRVSRDRTALAGTAFGPEHRRHGVLTAAHDEATRGLLGVMVSAADVAVRGRVWRNGQ